MDIEPNNPDSVRGLMDSQRVAAYLGVPRGTIRSWAKRKSDGTPGVHSKFPDPLPEQLGGTALWEEDDILKFKKTFDEINTKRPKKTKRAADLLQSVESKHD